MRKLLVILIFSLLFSGCTARDLFIKKPAGLEINTTPQSEVFINGESSGTTPFKNENVSPGDYTIRLVPVSSDGDLSPWESNIRLTSRVSTIISHTFAVSDTASSGFILQLQPDADKSHAFLSLISDPDTSNISLDGQPQGFTPVTKLEVSPGSHTIEFSSPGYNPISIPINTIESYNLIVNAKLSQDLIVIKEIEVEDATASADTSEDAPGVLEEETSEVTEIAKPYVIIEETGTGWLRVRKEPNGEELGKADVGEKLPYFETNETGWYKIEFEGIEGWISGKYASIVR